MNKLYVAKIVNSTSIDGVGLRNSLYVSGCNIHCKGCHNKELWPLNSGKEMSVEDVYKELMNDDFNISILGGEPLLQYDAILDLCKMIKRHSAKTIWLWTGLELVRVQDSYPKLLDYVDVLVDGPYKEQYKDINMVFRGSSNQKIYQVNHCNGNSVTDITNQF